MQQATLDDEARAAGNEAVERVRRNNQDWLNVAHYALAAVCVQKPNGFTADDVWQALADRGAPAPDEPRALGAVIRTWLRDGMIAHTGRYVRSRRPACHGRPLPVYTYPGLAT